MKIKHNILVTGSVAILSLISGNCTQLSHILLYDDSDNAAPAWSQAYITFPAAPGHASLPHTSPPPFRYTHAFNFIKTLPPFPRMASSPPHTRLIYPPPNPEHSFPILLHTTSTQILPSVTFLFSSLRPFFWQAKRLWSFFLLRIRGDFPQAISALAGMCLRGESHVISLCSPCSQGCSYVTYGRRIRVFFSGMWLYVIYRALSRAVHISF